MKIKRILPKSFILVLAFVIMMLTLTTNEAYANTYTPPEGRHLIALNKSRLAPGVNETEVVTNDSTGKSQVTGYALEVDISLPTAGIIATYKDHNASTWGMQTVREQAAAAERKTGLNIVAGVNADFYNMSTGQPNGALVMNGVEYNNSWQPFFGIKKDGTAVIGEGHEYQAMKSEIKEAVGGSIIMVKNGELNVPQELYYDQLNPRTAIGIKADGKVILYTADGRNYPQSVGLNLYDLAQMMKSLGAVTALNLDGGGSTTYISKREGTGVLTLRNVPSDGRERTVSSSLLVYSSAVYDGQFSHASISPANGLYTPYTTLDFSAIGVDSAGGPANLPTDLEWRVDDNSFGTINEFGHFTSSGKEGTFTVSLYRNGVNVGSATNEIRMPDEVRFKNPEMSLGFEKVSDLGLQAFHEGRPITINDNDFDFEYDPIMGTFNGRMFTSSDSASHTGVIIAQYRHADISGSLTLTVGLLPVVIYDFEDPDTIMRDWNISTANRNETGSIEVVDYSSGEPVRFGDKSLKINFDFTQGHLGTTLGVYAGVASEVDIPGSPTHIGMWVYATPEAQGFWLRMRVIDVTGQVQQVDFSKEGTGIDWLGWKYVEGSLENYSGPFKTMTSQMIRLMMLRSGQPNSMGQMVAGHIYIDDLRVVYGANTDDLYAPQVDSIKLNNEEVDGQTFTTNKFTLEANFSDYMDDKYVTGMDYDKINVLIDGINYRGNEHFYALDAGGNRVFLNEIELPEGEHEVKLIIRDLFGNETEETRYFTVNTGANNKVKLEPRTDKPVLGHDFITDLSAELIENVDRINMLLNVSHEPINIIFNEDFTGTYTYNATLKTVSIQAERHTDAVDLSNKVIASVVFDVPQSSNQNTIMGYSIKLGEVTYRDQVENTNYLSTFSTLPYQSNVAAGLDIKTGIVIHQVNGNFFVADRFGNAVADAELFLVNPNGDISLGFTDSEGYYVDEIISSTVGQTQIYATKNGETSFKLTVNTVIPFGTDALPFLIKVNASVNGGNGKNVSWVTNPTLGTGESILQMALKSDYQSRGVNAFKNYEGNNIVHQFTGAANPNERHAIRINYASANDLLEGKTYVYRVGDGQNWSEVKEISTSITNGETNFFVLGDVQTHNFTELREAINSINQSKRYDFGISTGDLIDELSKWAPFYETSSVLADSWVSNVDMISALGNHEYMGDMNGAITSAYYNLPGHEQGPVTHYSVRYGSVYVAVINFTQDRAGLTESLEWLVDDANQSDAIWKIIVTHQPTYYTNIVGGNGLFLELVPQYATEAGIDFVFSGHDHSYARTKPMINNVVNQDGTVYVISGSIGEKSYSAWNDPTFNFDIVLDSYQAVYMTVTATDTTFTYNLYETTGELVDSYSRTKEVDKSNEKFYINGDRLISSITGYSIPLASYTGFAYVEATGAKKYFIAGNFVRGWFSVNTDKYHADYYGNVHTGVTFIEGAEYIFDEEGLFIKGQDGFVNYNNRVRYYINGTYATGWKTINGYKYYFEGGYGAMQTGEVVISGITYQFDEDGRLKHGTFLLTNDGFQYYYGGQQRNWQYINDSWYYFSGYAHGLMRTGASVVEGRNYIFSNTGQLIRGSFVKDANGTRYYWGPNYVTGWFNIDGQLYYFNNDGYLELNDFDYNGMRIKLGIDGVYIPDYNNYSGPIKTIIGKYIVLNGVVQKGWIDYNGYKYYSDSNGIIQTGYITIGNILYFFNDEGILINFSTPKEYMLKMFLDSNGYDFSIEELELYQLKIISGNLIVLNKIFEEIAVIDLQQLVINGKLKNYNVNRDSLDFEIESGIRIWLYNLLEISNNITFYLDNYQIGNQTINKYSKVNYIEVEKENQIFIGWKDINTGEFISSDLILYDVFASAVFEKKLENYTLNFYSYNNQIIETYIIKENENFIYPSIPSRLGYTFIDWEENESEVSNTYDFHPIFEIEFLDMPIITIEIDIDISNVNREDYRPAIISLLNTTQSNELYDLIGEFRGRGNGSWEFDKKGYRIKFDKKQSLLGQPKSKHWALIANANDLSLSRNFAAYRITKNNLDNIEYQTSTNFVEVFINGEYHGVYNLVEQIRVESDRVNIDDEYGVIDTGYLIEYDAYAYNEGVEGINYFKVNGLKYPFTVKSPDPDDFHEEITEELYRSQVNFIKNYIQNVVDAVLNDDLNLFIELVDIDSVIDVYIIHELFKNTDTGFSSFYMYKKKGDKLYFGPVWDFDLSAGSTRGDVSYEGLYVSDKVTQYSSNTANEIYINLMKNEEFVNKVKNRYIEISEKIRNEVLNIFEEIQGYQNSFTRDGLKWTNNSIYEIRQNYVKNWLLNRISWLENWAK